MSLPLAFFLALVLCLTSVLRNHVAAPDSILPTPVLLIAITGLLNWRQPYVVASAAGTALLICLHDAGLRFYGGGAHDGEEDGVITALLFMGLLPAYALLLLLLGRAANTASRGRRVLATLVPPVLIGVYLMGLRLILFNK